MTISHEQAEWFKATFDQLTDNMAGVAIGLVVASAALLVAVLLLSRRRANRLVA